MKEISTEILNVKRSQLSTESIYWDFFFRGISLNVFIIKNSALNKFSVSDVNDTEIK